MAFLPDLDRTSFENLTKGVHDLTDEEIARLHEMANEVKAIVKSAIERQDRAMMARNQFRQMGGPHQPGVISEGVPAVPQPSGQSAPSNEIDQSHRQWE